VANTLYWKKKYEEALKEYQKVVGTEELELEQQSYFNLGNALYRMGKLPESILAYQQALKLNPDDMDAKYNLEYVRRKLKENAQKEPQSGQQEQQQQQEGEQQKEGEDQEKKDQQQQSGDQEQKNLNKLSKEEAERILDALKNDEKDIQKKRKMKASGKVRVKKDW
jgi:tetratricopeptide (TPR) repeat protein